MDIPYSSLSFLRSFKICAWIVTSSAVVGSSSRRSEGLATIAAAIMDLCSIPPESS